MMFALVDCNNFYASCERVFRPDLNGQPVVVLSNNDGCVIARSNEAKEAGIPMGAPAFKYAPIFASKGIKVFSANFALYGDMSQRVMSLLQEFAPDLEIYSIDEAFLQLTDLGGVDLPQYAAQMRRRVTKCTGIPISIGLAPTKVLAKVANRIAKKFAERTANVHVIDSEAKRIKALQWLKVGDVWGIGRQHVKRLQAAGIGTAYDFSLMDPGWVKKHMGVVGVRLQRDLQGIPTLGLAQAQAKKNIAITRSFEENYTRLAEVQERVTTFAVACAEKLRRQGACCNALMVFVRTNRHRGDLAQYGNSAVIQLPFPTNSGIELAKFATGALKGIFREGYAYKKAGVIAMGFTPATDAQLNLFADSDPRHVALMKAVDGLNASFGQQKVRLASQDAGRVWKMKQERLSPRYTTRLEEIIQVKV